MATHSSDIDGSVPTPATAAPGSLGQLLRRARERRSLTLDQVSNDTKIPRRHLDAIERDNLSALPVGFYLRAQVRVYARAVNLDPNLAVGELDRVLNRPAARPDGPGPSKAGDRKSPVLRQWVLIVAGVLVAAVVLARSMGGREPVRDAATGAENPPVTVGVPAPRSPTTAPEDAPAPAVQPAPSRSVADSPSGTAQEEQSARPTAPVSDQVPPQPMASPAPDESIPPPRPSSPPSVGANTSEGLPTEASPSAAAVGRPVEPAEQPVTPPPTAPPPMLVLITEPAGARVTVNGIGYGTAPITIRYLPSGDKLVRASKEGYVTEERVIRIAEGRPARVDIQLRPAR